MKRWTCCKGKSERDRDSYLFNYGISHGYEEEIPYGATGNKVMHLDLFLLNYLGQWYNAYIVN